MANPRTIAKLEARIHERAAHALEFEVRDPRNVLVTITRVELSSDLSHAKIFYSVLGSRSERSKAEHMLASAGGFIQRQVARVLETRKVPHLNWIYDEAIEQAQELDSAIRRALERDRIIAQTGVPPTDEEDLAPEAGEADDAEDLGDEDLDEVDLDDVDADADEDADDKPEGDAAPGRA